MWICRINRATKLDADAPDPSLVILEVIISPDSPRADVWGKDLAKTMSALDFVDFASVQICNPTGISHSDMQINSH